MVEPNAKSVTPTAVAADASKGASISLVTLRLSLSAFFLIACLICVLGYLVFPSLPIEHAALSIFLPGFEL